VADVPKTQTDECKSITHFPYFGLCPSSE